MLPALKLSALSRQAIEEKAYEKLKMLGMEDHALKLSSKLSGGQQQRIAIARALINDPDIIMGDEPTGNLDSYNTHMVFDIFQELTHTFKQTIVAVTHDENFAQKSDRVVEMSDGRIVSEGKKKQMNWAFCKLKYSGIRLLSCLTMKDRSMENKINLDNRLHPYLLQFNYAQMNFAKFIEEERLEKRRRRMKLKPRESAWKHPKRLPLLVAA